MLNLLSAKKNPLITGTLVLTFAGIASRGIGFFYRLFLAQAFGEEQIGLLQLLSPVIMISFSLTGASMQTTISRYTASSIALGRPKEARHYLFVGAAICLVLSCCYSFLIYQRADVIALHLLKETRLAPLLKVIAFSFPLTSLHCCLNGYFYGQKQVKIPSFCQLAEQIIRTGSCFLLYLYLSSKGKVDLRLALFTTVLGELISCLISWFAYQNLSASTNAAILSPQPKTDFCSPKISSTIPQLLSMAVPLSLSRLIVNLLQSIESISLPQKLQDFGYSVQTSLSIYGVLTGMAFSLILFPSAFTQSASVLLLPEVTQAAASSAREKMTSTILRSLLASTALGLLFFCFFFLFGEALGQFLFHSSLAGVFIRQLSFLCPFLYLHSTFSGILNGLKKTGASLLIDVSSLLLRLVFTIYLVPVIGIKGYLWGLLCSELFSSFCHFCVIRNILSRYHFPSFLSK